MTTDIKVVTIRAAAMRLGVHENTIRNWVAKRLVAAYRLPSGIRRIPEAEVERLEREIFAVPKSFAPDEHGPVFDKAVEQDDYPTHYPSI